MKIIEFNKGGRIGDLIKEAEFLKEKVGYIKKVKNFLLFNVIYDMNSGKDEIKKFDNSQIILNDIGKHLNVEFKKEEEIISELNEKFKEYFKKIKEKLCNNEDEAKNFINDLEKYYDIKNKELINELTILFKSKKYELDIKSIKFFFKYLNENIIHDNNKEHDKGMLLLNSLNEWEDNFQTIKKNLEQLKKDNIYDYTNIKNYNKIFTCLYNKKEAIDFLFSKTSKEISKLKDKIQPTDRTISIKDIYDTQECVNIITIMGEKKSDLEIFNYITQLNDETIAKFENYSKVYSSIIELDTDDDISDNIYDKVFNIFKEAYFNIEQDSENFLYKNDETNDFKSIDMKELVLLKNQIYIKNDIEKSKDENIIKKKCNILQFFKEKVSKSEIIIDYMNILRQKGSSLPIKIHIKININNFESSIEYYLEKYQKEYEEIINFLFDAKNSYISQLDSFYKAKLNIRFLYGKQFRIIMKHIENNFKIDSFLRYILNDTESCTIKEGDKYIKRNVSSENYIFDKLYETYSKNSLESISEYITDLFKKNEKTLEKHYEDMKIKTIESKGIYLHNCNKSSMEKYIITLFRDKIASLPIAQNVLITNKETTSEEIQAFFHRAILCNYNTLFVVEINDSFSDFQQSIMNTYIDILLSHKNYEYNKQTKENVDKKSTNIYLDSCIYFIYNNYNKNIVPFIKEIEKFISKKKMIYLKQKN